MMMLNKRKAPIWIILVQMVLLLRHVCLGLPVFGLLTHQVELNPDVDPGSINSIVWKKGPNKAAEWDRNGDELDYYTACNNRCELNTTTGQLCIKGLTVNDIGTFSVEVNGRGPPKIFQLTVLTLVSKPKVTHTCNMTACTLVCEGEDSKHTRYFWKEDGEEEKHTLLVLKDEHVDKTYTCVGRNNLSEAESEPFSKRDLFPKETGWKTVAVGLMVFVAVLITVGAAVCCYVKRRKDTGPRVETVYDVVRYSASRTRS